MNSNSRTGSEAATTTTTTIATATPGASCSEAHATGRRPIVAAQLAAAVGVSSVAAGGGIAATELAGAPAAAMPLGAIVIGTGAGATAITKITQRNNRSIGLQVGYDVATIGALLGLIAVRVNSLVVLLVGTTLIGVGNSAVMLSRYALADLGPAQQRARTIGRSLLVVAAGSILGPLLLGPAGRAAELIAMPALSGTYAAAAGAFALAAIVLVVGRTGQRGSGRILTNTTEPARPPHQPSDPTVRSIGQALWVLATANLTMVTMMAVYPSHLHHTGHSLGLTSIIVSAHVGSMFAASSMLGRWTDLHGAKRVATLGAATTATSCVLTATLPTDDARVAALALVVLGVGWNAQLIAGSALLTAHTRSEGRRAQLESHGEIVMSAAAAAGALVLAPVLVSQTDIRTLAATMIPLHSIVTASTLLPRRHRHTLRLETTR